MLICLGGGGCITTAWMTCAVVSFVRVFVIASVPDSSALAMPLIFWTAPSLNDFMDMLHKLSSRVSIDWTHLGCIITAWVNPMGYCYGADLQRVGFGIGEREEGLSHADRWGNKAAPRIQRCVRQCPELRLSQLWSALIVKRCKKIWSRLQTRKVARDSFGSKHVGRGRRVARTNQTSC